MKKVFDLVLRIDDHKHDDVGKLFGDPPNDREARKCLRAHLGSQCRIKEYKLVSTKRLKVRVELQDFQAESDNLVRLARQLVNRRRAQAAIGQLEEALKIFPLNGTALKSLGRAHYGRQDYAAAGSCFVRANEVLREDGEALRALGTISLREGREEDAIGYFTRAVKVNPNDEAATQALEQIQAHIAQRGAGESGSSAPESPK